MYWVKNEEQLLEELDTLYNRVEEYEGWRQEALYVLKDLVVDCIEKDIPLDFEEILWEYNFLDQWEV